MKPPVALLLGLLLTAPVLTAQVLARSGSWSQWRGPLGSGASPDATPPLTWSESGNVRWKTALPGQGHSSPVVAGDRVFVTAAIPVGEPVPPPAGERDGEHDNLPTVRKQQFAVIALARSDGRILWQRTVAEAVPHEVHHRTASDASSSPVTDGRLVYASFGSRGVHALTVDGAPVWKVDLGTMQTLHAHGEGSSPALHGDTLVVNWDHEGADFVVALDARTGKVRWKAPRDEVTSWSTPLIVVHAGKPQVIVGATSRVRAYDLATGAVIWECGGMSQNVVASPVAGDGMVFLGSSYEKKAMLAIRLDGAKGDITNTDRVAWTRAKDTPYVPSPLHSGGRLYFLRHYQAVLTCVDAATGKPHYGPQRLQGLFDVYASPVAAAGRVYITSREGLTCVLADGPRFEVLATNKLDDSFSASAALAGRELYLRGERFLYCLEERAPAPR